MIASSCSFVIINLTKKSVASGVEGQMKVTILLSLSIRRNSGLVIEKR